MPGISGFWIFMLIFFSLTPFALISWVLIARFKKHGNPPDRQKTGLSNELKARRRLRKKTINKRFMN